MPNVASRIWAGLITAFIAVVLAIQAYASILGDRPGAPFYWQFREAAVWPFISYPMYSNRIDENGRVNVRGTAIVVAPDGTRTRIEPEDLGMTFWIYRNAVLLDIRRGHTEKLQTIFADYCTPGTAALTLEVEDDGYIVTRSGLGERDPETIATLDMPCRTGA